MVYNRYFVKILIFFSSLLLSNLGCKQFISLICLFVKYVIKFNNITKELRAR